MFLVSGLIILIIFASSHVIVAILTNSPFSCCWLHSDSEYSEMTCSFVASSVDNLTRLQRFALSSLPVVQTYCQACNTMRKITVLVTIGQLLNISKQLSCRLLVLSVYEGYGGPSQNSLWDSWGMTRPQRHVCLTSERPDWKGARLQGHGWRVHADPLSHCSFRDNNTNPLTKLLSRSTSH